jgi:hypothetical protein
MILGSYFSNTLCGYVLNISFLIGRDRYFLAAAAGGALAAVGAAAAGAAVVEAGDGAAASTEK